MQQLAQDPAVQRRSRVLFGQAHRLAVMYAVARSDGLINPSEVAEQLGFRAQSSIQSPIRDLVDSQLISRRDFPQDRRTYYIRNDSKVWDWIKEVIEEFVKTAAATSSVVSEA